MYTKTNHRVLRRVFALVLAMAMVTSLLAIRISAATADFKAPEKAMTVDKNLITVSAHSQAFLLPEIIGLTNTTSRNTELPDVFATNAEDAGPATMCLNDAQKTAILGVFGSNINQKPNPYMYNYFYNAWATENEKDLAPVGEYTMSTGIGNMFSPANAANAGGITDPATGMEIPVSIYLKQDILLGCNPRSEDGKTGYTDVIAAYNSAYKDTYAPYEVDYEMSRVYSFLQNLYSMAGVAHEINDQTGKTWRYSDPTVIAGDVEKYVKGLEAYVMKKLKEDNRTPEVVAVVDTSYTTKMRQSGKIANNEWVLNTSECSTQRTTSHSRVAEFAADTTTNLADVLGGDLIETPGDIQGVNNNFYKATSDEIAQNADLVLFTDVTMSTTGEASDRKITEFKQNLVDTLQDTKLVNKVDSLEMMTSAFDCVGSIGANSVENILGMAYFTAYIYPEYLDQFAVAAYWYNNFYHISSASALKSTMASNFATSSVREAAGNRSAKNLDYDKAAVEAQIIEGMNYYENNRSEFEDKLINQNGETGENTGWVIDWENGIGAEQREEPAPVEPETRLNGVVKGPDGKWGYYVDDVLQTNYTGIKNNDYGWWRIENGLVNFKANGIYKNEYGWWKTTNGKVTFNETGVFKNDYGWWRVEKSKVNFKANGIYKNDYGWWKTTNGKVTFKETGVFKNDYGWWRVEKSKVNFKANGLYKNEYGTWYVKNGKVDFSYNGTYQGKTIKNGKVV